MGLRVLDPRLDAEGEAMTLAPPLGTLDGAAIGLLDNAKIGTAQFFDHVERILRSRWGVREGVRPARASTKRLDRKGAA